MLIQDETTQHNTGRYNARLDDSKQYSKPLNNIKTQTSMVQFVNLCAACCAISFSWDWGKRVCFEDQDGEKEKDKTRIIKSIWRSIEI
jgi:hypothetical protein